MKSAHFDGIQNNRIKERKTKQMLVKIDGNEELIEKQEQNKS